MARNLYPIQALEEVEEAMDTLILEEVPPMERTWNIYEESSSEEEGDEYEEVEPPKDEYDFDNLLKSFNHVPNHEPKCLLKVIDTLKDYGQTLKEQELEIKSLKKQLKCRIISLEKTVAVQHRNMEALQRGFQGHEGRLKKIEDTTSPRTYKLEAALAHMVKSNMQEAPKTLSLDDQKLEELKQEVLSTYTPELLCLAVKKESSQLSPVDQMIHLAKRADRLSQIKRYYEPSSNFCMEPVPLSPDVIDSLKSLPSATHQKRIQGFWQDIVRIYNEDHVLCTQFEVESILFSKGTYGEKRNQLAEFLLSGQKLQEGLKSSKKTSFARAMSFRKKDKISKSFSHWDITDIPE